MPPEMPETRYAKSGDVHIAYQVLGDGPIDLVYVPGFASHVEYQWEDPACARGLLRLACAPSVSAPIGVRSVDDTVSSERPGGRAHGDRRVTATSRGRG
jgi:hypothetical protein